MRSLEDTKTETPKTEGYKIFDRFTTPIFTRTSIIMFLSLIIFFIIFLKLIIQCNPTMKNQGVPTSTPKKNIVNNFEYDLWGKHVECSDQQMGAWNPMLCHILWSHGVCKSMLAIKAWQLSSSAWAIIVCMVRDREVLHFLLKPC